MSIRGISKIEFKEIVRRHFTPATPISHHERLHGRDDVLTQIERAFNTQGKHVFVFGDRGVGKTSLAKSASLFHQSSEAIPPIVECEPTADAYQLFRDLALLLLPTSKAHGGKKTQDKLTIGVPGISYQKSQELACGSVPTISSINEALSIITYLARAHSKEPVVIIDEYDQLGSIDARKLVASFIKHVSEQEIPLRFIICGIGDSLDEMIGSHPSTGRSIAPIRLGRISPDARWAILSSAAGALGIEIDRETLVRTGFISDGFPYYVHLIGDKLAWAMFDDEEEVSRSQPKHFERALLDAMEEAEASLKQAYRLATQKYKDDYQEILWAVADKSDLSRQASEIHSTSYKRIMEQRKKQPLARKTFDTRIRALCDPSSHGAILRSTGLGWYEFTENRLRGYVRLAAERNGVQLESEHHLGLKLRSSLTAA